MSTTNVAYSDGEAELRQQFLDFIAKRIAHTTTLLNSKTFFYRSYTGIGQPPIMVFDSLRYDVDERQIWAADFPNGVNGSSRAALKEYVRVAKNKDVWSKEPHIGYISSVNSIFGTIVSTVLADNLSVKLRPAIVEGRSNGYALTVSMPLLAYLFNKQARQQWRDVMSEQVC